MKVLKAIVYHGWALIIISAVAITGYVYEWPIAVLSTIIGIVLIIGLVTAVIGAREKELEKGSRACDMSQRVFNTWCSGFTSRLEVDTRTGRFTIYLRSYLNELWLMTNLYYEFVEQFYEIAQKIALPTETLEQYNRFVVEYNSFAEQFRELIGEMKRVAHTEVEPPSVKLAHEVLTIPLAKEK